MEDKQIRSHIRERLKRLARPTTEKDLLKQLRLKSGDRQAAKRVIEEMVAKGELVRTHADRIGLPEKMDVVAGRLEVKRGGFGFVVPNERGLQDVYVAGPNLADALHGDRVLVHIERTGHEGKPEGRIVRVLERRTSLAGATPRLPTPRISIPTLGGNVLIALGWIHDCPGTVLVRARRTNAQSEAHLL